MRDAIRNKIDSLRAMRVRQMSRYWQAMADVPAALCPYWKRTACFEFKGIPQDAFFFACATEGLLTFFDCASASGKPCGLPSAAADSVWHAWTRLAPASLDASASPISAKRSRTSKRPGWARGWRMPW